MKMLTGSKTTFKVRQMLPDIKVRSYLFASQLVSANITLFVSCLHRVKCGQLIWTFLTLYV